MLMDYSLGKRDPEGMGKSQTSLIRFSLDVEGTSDCSTLLEALHV